MAGFGATLVLSVMMLGKQAVGFMPQFGMIGMRAGMMDGSRGVGWRVHFMVGTALYGGAFVVPIAVFGTVAYVLTGLLLGALGRLVGMVALMPMANNGPFGVKLGSMVPVLSLRSGSDAVAGH